MMNRGRVWGLVMVTALATVSITLLLIQTGGAEPQIGEPTVLNQSLTDPAGNFVLEPVQDGYVPKVSVEDALDTALEEAAIPRDLLETIQPVLARFSWSATPVDDQTDDPVGPPLYEDAAVWVFEVYGPCFAYALNDLSKCAAHDQKLVVDAETGDFIVGYSSIQAPQP